MGHFQGRPLFRPRAVSECRLTACPGLAASPHSWAEWEVTKERFWGEPPHGEAQVHESACRRASGHGLAK